MKTKITTAIVLVAVFLYSCGGSKSVATATTVETVKKVELTPALAEGKGLYENNCAKCHRLYDPAEYTAEKWTGILKWMQPKAKITDEQRTTIYNYLVMNK
ncbi:cytochrome c [Flavobacterium sp. SUN052]|uniref:c-type cytochrome n=1 Tax=Flavobacterium sp. SUN052 TaxID=3002441 RepID=UPI00237E3E0F|nr:cytochrome c [Flavobacterium sp. SUN052]MEC4005026.1 cytochrome c [Flavobacterium sp. SUN052]